MMVPLYEFVERVLTGWAREFERRDKWTTCPEVMMFAELGALHAPLLRHLQDQGAAHKKTVASVDRVVWHRFARGGDQAALDIYCLVCADSADKLTEASVRSTWGYFYFLGGHYWMLNLLE